MEKKQSMPCRCPCDLHLLPNNSPENIFPPSKVCPAYWIFLYKKGIHYPIWRMSYLKNNEGIFYFWLYAARRNTDTHNMSRGGIKIFRTIGPFVRATIWSIKNIPLHRDEKKVLYDLRNFSFLCSKIVTKNCQIFSYFVFI